jgi:hypothetical protein
MTDIEFRAWPKTNRLSREVMTITEKIDGTNAAVGVKAFPFGEHVEGVPGNAALAFGPYGEDGMPGTEYLVYAQSRKRLITPEADNHGFARWVWDNAEALAQVLGEGLHFGEWWGSGINRGYGLPQGEKRFSLFNTRRWGWLEEDRRAAHEGIPDALGVVPVISTGGFDPGKPWVYLAALGGAGSLAAPGFMSPEGIVIHLALSNVNYKMTFDGDQPKYLATAPAPNPDVQLAPASPEFVMSTLGIGDLSVAA